MKLAYVTTYDASDVHAWSGSGNYILRSLQDGGFQTECIGDLKTRDVLAYKIKKAVISKFFHKTYDIGREPRLLMDYARQVEKSLSGIDYDIVFSPGTMPISYLETDKPVVFWTDSTFAGMMNFYPGYTNFCSRTIKNGNSMEQSALTKCHYAIYASEWAANTAIQSYNVDPAKVKVVPFGANINCNRSAADISNIVESKSLETCKLLFLGIDWYRKGGDKALAVAELLNRRGLRTELHIVGCNPTVNLPDFVKCHGFISKKTSEGNEQLNKLMAESHFLILPSLAECFGVVFAEASSFGLPSIATKVGGIPTAVKDGKNGQTFLLDETPEKYCDYIEGLMSSKQEYCKLALSSFEEYSTRLNWLSAGRKVHELISGIVERY